MEGTAPGKRRTDLQADSHTRLERLHGTIQVGVVTFGIPATTFLKRETSEVALKGFLRGTGMAISGREYEPRPKGGWHILNVKLT